MKNNRESWVLLGLLAIMLVYGFYSYLIKPKVEANKVLEEEIALEEEQLVNMYTVAAGYSGKLKQLNEHKDSLRKQSSLFYARDNQQEEFLDKLHGYFAERNLQLVSITSNDYADTAGDRYPGSVSPYMAYFADSTSKSFSLSRSLSSDSEEVKKLPRVEQMDITFEYKGIYEDIQNFFEALGGVDKFVVCNALEVRIAKGVVFEEESEEEQQEETENVKRDEDSEEEKDLTPDSMEVTISVPRLWNLTALETEVENLDNLEVVMPKNLADGSYKKMYTFENLSRAVKGIFSGE